MAQLKQREIDRIYNALRPRLGRLGGGGGTVVVTIPPHTHSADQIGSNASGDVAAENVQAAIEEIAAEKLARDGSQTVTGDLDHDHHSIVNVDDADIEGVATVGEDITMTGGVGLAKLTGAREITFVADADGEAVINNVRSVHFVGDHSDSEAQADGLERVVFNNEPTASSIEGPSRVDWNVAVEAGVDYTPIVGRTSWDSLERTLCVFVASGA